MIEERSLSHALWDLLSGLAIAVIVHSLDPSLSTQLIGRSISPWRGKGKAKWIFEELLDLSIQQEQSGLYSISPKYLKFIFESYLSSTLYILET